MSNPRQEQRRLLTERARRARDVVRLADVDTRPTARTAPAATDGEAHVRRVEDGPTEFGLPAPTWSPFPSELLALVPVDGEWHHVAVADGVTYVDGGEVKAGHLQVAPHRVDTRRLVVVRLEAVTVGRGTGWRATCSVCPGFAPGNRKGEARGRAYAHVQEHDAAGHRVELHEPAGDTKPKRRRSR